jgi:hypothetical protein
VLLLDFTKLFFLKREMVIFMIRCVVSRSRQVAGLGLFESQKCNQNKLRLFRTWPGSSVHAVKYSPDIYFVQVTVGPGKSPIKMTSGTEAFCTFSCYAREGCSSVQRSDEWSSTPTLCDFTVVSVKENRIKPNNPMYKINPLFICQTLNIRNDDIGTTISTT